MTGDTKIHRIRQFFGGIVTGERDKKIGVGLNFEELDIFTNPDYIEPETIFADDSVIARGYWDVTDDGTHLFAIGETADGTPKTQLWKRENGMANGLATTTWASYLTSGENSLKDSFLKCHTWDDGTKHLYFVSGTNDLRKYGDIAGTPSESSVGSLSGVSTSSGRLPTHIQFGELFIGHGRYIAKVDDSGTFTDKAWTAPSGFKVVDIAPIGENMAVLCSPISTNSGTSAIFFWDLTATTGFIDSVYMPTGNAQMIVNHNESIRVFCVSNTTTTSGTLKIYELLGKKPLLTHTLENIDIAYNTPTAAFNYSVSPKTKVIINNILYFGIAKTDKSGIYALGQVSEDRPLALVLSRRSHTTDYSNHYPICLYSAGKDLVHCMYDSNTTAQFRMKQLVYSSATRSSSAVYESIFIDDNSPETTKKFDRFYLVTDKLPASTAIAISARVDDIDNSYSSNRNANAGTSNSFDTDNNTYHTVGTDFNGKAIQLKVAWTSNSTDRIRLYSIGVRSVEEGTKQSNG